MSAGDEDSLSRWLSRIENPNNDFVQQMQKNVFHNFANNFQGSSHGFVCTSWAITKSKLIETCSALQGKGDDDSSSPEEPFEVELSESGSENIVEEFVGQLDQFANGTGHFGKRNTKSNLIEMELAGGMREGQVEGLVRETQPCRSFTETFYQEGQRNGFFRKFRADSTFQEMGVFVRGTRIPGVFVKKMSGKSYIISMSDWDNEEQSCTCVYLYPDLESAIQGRFRLSYDHKEDELTVRLVKGGYGKVVDLDWKDAFPHIQLSLADHVPLLSFDPATFFRISRQPLLGDGYELETVYVRASSQPNAGEGLFAKRPIGQSQLICLFNGVKCDKSHLPRAIMASSAHWSDYRLNLDASTDIDIPLEYASLTQYKATLGHKACHSFSLKNAKFDQFFHPRFGLIMCLIALREINQDEEIFVNYNYNIIMAPDWYKGLWLEHVRLHLCWSEEKIDAWIHEQETIWGYLFSFSP